MNINHSVEFLVDSARKVATDINPRPLLTIIIPIRITKSRSDLIERLEYFKEDIHIPPNVNILVVDDGSRPEDYAKIKLLEDGVRVNVISTGRKHYQHFSLSIARNVGAQQADGEFILFYDADLAPYPNFFNDLLREIEINGMHEETTHFLMCPVIYLSDAGYEVYKTTSPELRRQFFISAMLRGDTDLIEKFSSGTSAIVVRRHYYLSRGGSDVSFQGWGFEDYELITRLIRRSRQFPLPENWLSCDGNFMTINKYSGWKSIYRLHGDWLGNKGIYLFHIPHMIETSYHINKDSNFKLLQRRMEEDTKGLGEPVPLPDLRSGRSLIMARNPFTTARDFIPYLGECIFIDGEVFSNQIAFANRLKKSRATRVIFGNPYSNQSTRLAYNWCRKNNFPYLVCERGALPDSVFHDSQGFLSDSCSYDRSKWDRELTEDEQKAVTEYIRDVRHGAASLEKQAARSDIHEIKRKLGIAPTDKVLFVPFQQPRDTVIKYFSGEIGNFESFYDLITSLPAKLGAEWKVIYKKHPVEDELAPIDGALDGSAYNINDLLEICDAVSLINSGTGVLGMMFGKPVYIFGECWYSHDGLNVKVKNADDLVDLIQKDFSLDYDRVCRFIHYLRFEFYSFGLQHQRRVRYEDGTPITATTSIDYYELRGFTSKTLKIKRMYKPIPRTTPLFDRYKNALAVSAPVKQQSSVVNKPVTKPTNVPTKEVISSPPAAHRSPEQQKTARQRKLREKPFQYMWDAVKKRLR